MYILDNLADWEISLIIAEIDSVRFLKKGIQKPKIVKVGNSLNPIKTISGIEITPDINVDNTKIEKDDLVI